MIYAPDRIERGLGILFKKAFRIAPGDEAFIESHEVCTDAAVFARYLKYLPYGENQNVCRSLFSMVLVSISTSVSHPEQPTRP